MNADGVIYVTCYPKYVLVRNVTLLLDFSVQNLAQKNSPISNIQYNSPLSLYSVKPE
jgi:hypothetical protein